MEYLPGCLTSLIADNQLELPMFLGIAKVSDIILFAPPSLTKASQGISQGVEYLHQSSKRI